MENETNSIVEVNSEVPPETKMSLSKNKSYVFIFNSTEEYARFKENVKARGYTGIKQAFRESLEKNNLI